VFEADDLISCPVDQANGIAIVRRESTGEISLEKPEELEKTEVPR